MDHYALLIGMLMGSRQDIAVIVYVQVATEWLFACPKDVLDRHLHGSTPASPVAHAQDRVTTPRRVGLTVCRHLDHKAYLGRPAALLYVHTEHVLRAPSQVSVVARA